jgi:hypothetical protein
LSGQSWAIAGVAKANAVTIKNFLISDFLSRPPISTRGLTRIWRLFAIQELLSDRIPLPCLSREAGAPSVTRQEGRFRPTINSCLFAFGGRGTGGGSGSICNTGASERFHSDFPSPVLALQYPKPVALDGLVFDGDGIVSRCPYAIVAT